MTNTQRNKRPARRPDCVTEVRMGNTVLVVSGYFKEDTTATAADKMMKVHVVQSRYGIVGLAVGNGGIYVKTDHQATHYRPLPKTVP